MLEGQMISRMQDYGQSMADSLRADDPRVSASVALTFLDGSRTTVAKAYTEVCGDWLFVVSVGDGFFLYHKADVLKWNSQALIAATTKANGSLVCCGVQKMS